MESGSLMGLITNALRALMPERKTAVAATVPIWDQGREQMPPFDYDRGARQGYMIADIVYACVELRATSAGEPPLCAYQLTDSGEEKIEASHPALQLLARPNPFMGRSRFWATVVMHLDIGGNAYIEKVRSRAGKLVELWLLRPDRVRVVPDATTFIRGYQYTVGADTTFLPAENVIHLKTRHPLDDYYGLPPLAAAAGRVDLDVWLRQFSQAFFKNAGIPAGLLNIVRSMNAQERKETRSQFRDLYGGPEGWHRLMVIDGGQAEYTPMGLPLGSNGTAMPELNQINETRIMSVFGVPPSLIPSMAGIQGNRGQTAAVSDRELFWESTMVPLFRDLDSGLTLGLADDFPDLERIEHDLSKIKALAEDEDKRHARYREDFKGGLFTWEETRRELGAPEKPDTAGIVLVPTTMVPTWSDEMLVEPAPPEPVPAPAPTGQPTGQPQPALNGRTNGAVAR